MEKERMMSLNTRPLAWELRDQEAWNTAAAELEAEGYNREHDSYWPAVFVKDAHESLVLVRGLGVLNWHPRER